MNEARAAKIEQDAGGHAGMTPRQKLVCVCIGILLGIVLGSNKHTSRDHGPTPEQTHEHPEATA